MCGDGTGLLDGESIIGSSSVRSCATSVVVEVLPGLERELATGHIVTRLTVNEKVLVLPKPEILATEKAIKESVKASVKVVKDALKAASKGSKKTKTP